MARLDREPTYEEIQDRCFERYGSRYVVATLFGGDDEWLMDVEHAVEQELFREKSVDFDPA